MSEIRVGDRVWAFSTRKWGKVIDTDSCHSATAMEFEVEFEDGSTSWHGFDDLFFEEIVIPPSARTRPKPKHEFKPNETLEQFFARMRFDEKHHLGLGDIRLSIGQQEELVSLYGNLQTENEDNLTPKHEFKPGDPVCVRRSSKNALWLLRAFVEERNGEFVCVSGRGWQDGWPECVPYDPTLLGFDAVEEKNDE